MTTRRSRSRFTRLLALPLWMWCIPVACVAHGVGDGVIDDSGGGALVPGVSGSASTPGESGSGNSPPGTDDPRPIGGSPSPGDADNAGGHGGVNGDAGASDASASGASGQGDGGTSTSGGAAGTSGAGGSAGTSGAGGGAGTSGAGGGAGTSGAGGSAGTSGAGDSGAGGSAGTSGAGDSGGGGSAGTSGAGDSGGGGSAGTSGAGGGAGGTSSVGGTGGASGSSGVCGNGLVEGTEVCDVAETDATYGQRCSTDCKFEIASAACVACELDSDCSGSVTSCLGSATVTFDAVAQKQCFDVMECINRTSCLDGAGSVGKCYCGTLSTAACGAAPFDLTAAGAPNGPCAAVMQAGYPGLTTNTAILGATTAGNRPTGAAGKRLNCDKTANEGLCLSACGLDSTATYP